MTETQFDELMNALPDTEVLYLRLASEISNLSCQVDEIAAMLEEVLARLPDQVD